MRSFLLLAAFLAPSFVQAQSHPLVGTWNVVVPVGMRTIGGASESITTTGVLTVTSTADSLIAQLTLEPMEGRPARPATRLAARLATGQVAFTSISSAQININGEVRSQPSTSTYLFEATGDALVGSVAREIAGMAAAGAQPITGTRAAR